MTRRRVGGMLRILVTLLGIEACGGGAPHVTGGGTDSGPDTAGSPSGASDGGDGGNAIMSGGGCYEGGASVCGAGDQNLPPEPTIPCACSTLRASRAVAAGTVPDETTLDTATIQSALDSCAPGQSVRLTASNANNAFVSGPLTLPSGISLWIDAGATLYASRNPGVYGGGCGTTTGTCLALIRARGTNSGVVGDGVIDGQGGELMIGQGQSWWDLTAASNGASGNPPLIQVQTATNFTLYRITLHNAPKAHVKLNAQGFVVWGVTLKTPSTTTNSQGTPLSAANAINTDGIDPGEAAGNGYIVCSKISVGDDQIAIKGRSGVNGITIAHNHFGFGHGMSIGSETSGGVANINVYDLSIDGTNSGMRNGGSNGIRIKSDPSQGGVVTNVTYNDVCVRDVSNPIIMNPMYSGTVTGALIPTFDHITIQNFHSMSSSVTQRVTLRGFDASHMTGITLDNVFVDGISPSNVIASYANVTLGPGDVNFMPAGASVTVTNGISGTAQANPCTDKWVTF